MRRVLVTGASGFIGRHVIGALASRGWDVHGAAIDAAPDGAPAVAWHRVDLLEPGVVARIVTEARATHLVHLAWYAEPGRYWTSRENHRWLSATIDLVSAFLDAGGTRIVGAGSCAEYDWQAGHCDEQATPARPATLYGACKLAAGVIVDRLAAQAEASSAWARFFFLFGPHEHPDRLVSSVVRALLAGREAPCSEGSQVRDFLFVKDLADAVAAILESDVCGPINVASGSPVSVRDLVMRIASRIGRPDLLQCGARPADPVPRLTAETTRLTREVGWRPRWSLDEALAETIDWWRAS